MLAKHRCGGLTNAAALAAKVAGGNYSIFNAHFNCYRITTRFVFSGVAVRWILAAAPVVRRFIVVKQVLISINVFLNIGPIQHARTLPLPLIPFATGGQPQGLPPFHSAAAACPPLERSLITPVLRCPPFPL